MSEYFIIPTVTVDDNHCSIFSEQKFPAAWRSKMLLSEQVAAVNFRWRCSDAGYSSDWHVAGDPTLIIVLSGCLRIILRNGDFRDFSAGSRFVAKDFLPHELPFDKLSHGHRAEVFGDDSLEAIHIKLSVLPTS